MNKKSNWQEFKAILDQHGITKLYHFTDRENLASIIKNGGLYSWGDCVEKGITVARPGGSDASHSIDGHYGLQRYVRVSFTDEHPMMYVAMSDGRISNPVVLEIDMDVIYAEDTKYADRNAAKNGMQVGGTLEDFKKIHFQSVKARKHFDLPPEEQMFFQAEVLVKNFIPLESINNIGNFGIPIHTIRVYQEHWKLWYSYSFKAKGFANQESIYCTDYKEYAHSIYLLGGSFCQHEEDDIPLW